MKKLMDDLGGGKRRCLLCPGSLPMIDTKEKVQGHIVSDHEQQYVDVVADSPVLRSEMVIAVAALPPLPVAA